MSYEDRLRDALAAKADELADRAPTVAALATDSAPGDAVTGEGGRAGVTALRSASYGRWAIAGLATAAALIAAVLLIGNNNPERISTGPEFAAAQATPTAAASPAPTNQPDQAPPAAAATATVVPTPEPTATPDSQVLLPSVDWTVDYFYSQVNPPFVDELATQYAAVDGDVLGPVLVAYALPHADYRRVGNPGGPYYDLVTPGGRTVRVRTDSAPAVLTAVVAHDPGSFVVMTYDLDEDDLIAAIDSVQVDGDRATLGDDLLQGLEVFESEPAQWALSTYNLKRAEEETVEVVTFKPELWQMVLGEREGHPDAEMISGDGFHGFIYPADNRGNDPGGVLLTEDATYVVRFPKWANNSVPKTVEEVREVLSEFAPRPSAPIFEALGLTDRAEVYGEWIANTPLPDGADLAWTLEGPPVNPIEEAFQAHQIFSCAWAGQWLATGDTSALDEIEASADWPTALIRDEEMGGATNYVARSIDEARTLTTEYERERSALRLDCSWLLGDVPQD